MVCKSVSLNSDNLVILKTHSSYKVPVKMWINILFVIRILATFTTLIGEVKHVDN